MLNGTYIFYVDGQEVHREDNLITKFGKRFLTTFIAGSASFETKDIALGVASSSDYALSDTNSRLGFEFYRLPVRYGSTDIQTTGGTTTYSVIFKTTVPQDIAGVIKEIGLYPGKKTSVNNFDSKFITAFEDNILWTENGQSYYPSYVPKTDILIPRIGDNYIKWDFVYGSTLNTTNTTREFRLPLDNFNLEGYGANDTITIAYNRVDTNSTKLRLKFYFSDTNYYYVDVPTFTDGTGDRPIKEVAVSTLLGQYSSSPTSKNITKLGIENTRSSTASNAIVYLDGIRINDEDTFDPTYGLISRATIDSPFLTKVNGRQLDIEYKLSLGF